VDTFSGRWEGKLMAQYSEPYTFYGLADDGISVWIDNKLLITRSNGSATVNLQAGVKYDIKVEYYENGGGAYISLFWSSPSTPKQIVPKYQLFSKAIPQPTPAPSPVPSPTPTPVPADSGSDTCAHANTGSNTCAHTDTGSDNR
jgi:hypothetical protein